jgi:hypothetical protein
MNPRRRRTDTVEAAIRMAGIELSKEAVLLGSKKAPDNGPYEVAFAVVDDELKPHLAIRGSPAKTARKWRTHDVRRRVATA